MRTPNFKTEKSIYILYIYLYSISYPDTLPGLHTLKQRSIYKQKYPSCSLIPTLLSPAYHVAFLSLYVLSFNLTRVCLSVLPLCECLLQAKKKKAFLLLFGLITHKNSVYQNRRNFPYLREKLV